MLRSSRYFTQGNSGSAAAIGSGTVVSRWWKRHAGAPARLAEELQMAVASAAPRTLRLEGGSRSEQALTRAVSDAVSVPVIASGGAGALPHFAEVLDAGHASAVLAASLFHFGTLTIPQVKAYLATHGVPVRR